MRVRSRCQKGEQGDGDEIAERGLRPANFSSTVEPGGVDEEDDGRDRDLAEPAKNEEQGGENDAPEAQLGKAYCGRKVEDVPGDPENERADQDHCDEYRDPDGKSAGDERADSKYAQYDAECRSHMPSL